MLSHNIHANTCEHISIASEVSTTATHALAMGHGRSEVSHYMYRNVDGATTKTCGCAAPLHPIFYLGLENPSLRRAALPAKPVSSPL